MARLLNEFFTDNAISLKAFLKKVKNLPVTTRILEAEFKPVKKGGDEVFALHLENPDLWISCNRTNADVLSKKFGQDVDKWTGKRIKVDKQVTGFQGQDGFKLTPA